MFKFLHAADIHLDSPLHGLDRYEGAPVAECRGATRRALENLVQLAIDEQVAFVLIAGDVYDGDWQDYNTGLFFVGQMARLNNAGIEVVLIRGNHDAQNRMTRHLRLPKDTHLFSYESAAKFRPKNCDDVVVHGQSYERWDLTDNLALRYPEAEPGVFNIGLLHTALEGRAYKDKYAPCSIADLKTKKYQYWALGHVHQREVIKSSDTVIAFPGNVQGRDIGEEGEKGCLLVTVDDGCVTAVQHHCLDEVRWKTCRIDAAGARDGFELVDRFRAQLLNEMPAADGRLLALRVELAGACRAHAAVAADWSRWVNEFRNTATEASDGRVWVERVVARTRLEVALGDDAEGPLAELNALLDELKTEGSRLQEFDDRALGDLRKKLDPELLGELDPRALLDQVGYLLINRLGGRVDAQT
jgi:DNA repair protein SbcD/Mre11